MNFGARSVWLCGYIIFISYSSNKKMQHSFIIFLIVCQGLNYFLTLFVFYMTKISMYNAFIKLIFNFGRATFFNDFANYDRSNSTDKLQVTCWTSGRFFHSNILHQHYFETNVIQITYDVLNRGNIIIWFIIYIIF